uniref:AlNc14C722G12448 protein n=1 Tax=Albugo laibachii Nc14 TaxID=890382 RepID=F0X1X1_9STRA|nr:AlNc14C722G12448 [Albugo laibachii Nc14]|eukprot:CCA27828.1 AlNc14C722G12448 [Albugo laibachii Nc14]
MEEAVQDGYVLNYWAVGYLMRCISQSECYSLKIKASNALISTEGIGGIFSHLPSINRPTGTDVSAKQTLSVTPVGTSQEHRAHLPLDIEHMNHSYLKRNEFEPEEVCLYGKLAFSAPRCEQCLQTKSGSGILKKYVLLQRKGSNFLNVIKTSDSKLLLKFCHRWKFCRRATAILSINLYKLFKHKVSSPVTQSGNIPKMHGTVMENFTIFPPNKGIPRTKDSYEEQLQEIDLSTHCLSTIMAFHAKNSPCWLFTSTTLGQGNVGMSQTLPKQQIMAAFTSLILDIPFSTNSEIAYSWKADDTFGCEHAELMPDIMCDYELNRMKNNLDLNNLPDGNEGSPPVSDTTNSRAVNVANVVVIKWTALDPENGEEVVAFGNPCICLSRNRKVVLISVNKRYVWMVDSGSLPNCKACDRRVTFGPQFPYNQFLRQIPVKHVRVMLCKSEKRKRSETDEVKFEEENLEKDETRSEKQSGIRKHIQIYRKRLSVNKAM